MENFFSLTTFNHTKRLIKTKSSGKRKVSQLCELKRKEMRRRCKRLAYYQPIRSCYKSLTTNDIMWNFQRSREYLVKNIVRVRNDHNAMHTIIIYNFTYLHGLFCKEKQKTEFNNRENIFQYSSPSRIHTL